MSKLPKIQYGTKNVGTFKAVIDGVEKEVLNVKDKNGIYMYHKHKLGVCMTRHQGSTPINCDGTITYSRASVSPANDQFVDVVVGCNKCGEYQYVEPNDGRDHNKYGNRCNRQTGTSYYDYYTYSCGFDAN